MPRDATQDVDVARDERALRDDHDGHPRMLGQHLENPARHAIASLRRLIGIGRRADENGLALDEAQVLVTPVTQRTREDFRGILLDENATLEGKPRWHRRRGL